MKLHVLFDKQGNIVAAAPIRPAAGGLAGQSRPVAQEDGHSATEVLIPSEHRHLELDEICSQLVVDVKGKKRTLIPKK